MTTQRVRVGDVLGADRKWITVDSTETYRPIGVKSFANGLIRYPACTGAELSKMRYFQLPPGSLVVSNIKAWEGAVALASADDVGLVASNRFLAYVSKSEEVSLAYVWHYFASEAGTKALSKASPGSADRNRTLGIKSFEDLVIPLPDVAEQRAIVGRLDQLSAVARMVERQRAIAAALPQAARNEIFSKLV